MELLGLEDFVVGFGVAFITMLALIGVAAAVVLPGSPRKRRPGIAFCGPSGLRMKRSRLPRSGVPQAA